MKRAAIYAHYDRSPEVALHAFYHLEQLVKLGFQIWFVSNSEISAGSRSRLAAICEKTSVRENSGLDFGMWKHVLDELDLSRFDELLLTNSSIIGPLRPLAELWKNPKIAGCDFWGLTDNSKPAPHLQSYFLVFQRQVVQSRRFMDFWHSVLPYTSKVQIVLSYELGLTRWLEEGGFKWKAAFPQDEIWPQALRQRSLARKIYHWGRRRDLSPVDSTLFACKALLQNGMPYLKNHLLRKNWLQLDPLASFETLKQFDLPPAVLEELRLNILKETAPENNSRPH
jgi:lipopolysaccharide biosynthesis protein